MPAPFSPAIGAAGMFYCQLRGTRIMSPTMSSLSARLVFIASLAVAVPLVVCLFVATLLGAGAMGLIASLRGPRQSRDANDGSLVIEGEYTVVESPAPSAPTRSPRPTPYRR
jgi:hypothetical protein